MVQVLKERPAPGHAAGASTLDVDHMAVLQQPVQDGRGQHLISRQQLRVRHDRPLWPGVCTFFLRGVYEAQYQVLPGYFTQTLAHAQPPKLSLEKPVSFVSKHG